MEMNQGIIIKNSSVGILDSSTLYNIKPNSL